MGAAELWTAVKAAYSAPGLTQLTNPNNRAATSINDTVGTSAAQAAIDQWPLYAQEQYDDANPQHVVVGLRAVIAVLWSRGATSSTIGKVEWSEVFGDDGLVGRIRKVGPRGRAGPVSNSGVQTQPENHDGRPVQGWSDRGAMPLGILPNTRPARY